MKQLHLLVLSLFFCTCSFAQTKPDGSTVDANFYVTDINGHSHDILGTLDSGNHVVICFFTAQDTHASWTYDTLHALQHYYATYGPGTTKHDARVFMYDVDPTTTNADITGTGLHTAGDWTAGNSFPICNESTPGAMGNFLDSGATSIPLPTCVVICKDSKMYNLSTSLITAADIRTAIDTFCGLTLGVHELIEKEFSYEFGPNPVNDNLNIHIRAIGTYQATVSIYNMLGALVYRSSVELQPGSNHININTGNWANGSYIISMSINDRSIHNTLVVQH